MSPNAADQFLFSCDDPSLRTSAQLVPAEHHNRNTGIDALPNGWLRKSRTRKIDQPARAQVLNKRQTGAPAKGHKFLHRRLFRKTGNSEIRGMHAQQQPRILVDRAFIIGDARAIRRPDFPKHRPALRHDFRDPESVPNLDQLAPRDNCLAAFRQRSKHQQHRSRAIVDHDSRLSAGQSFEQLGNVYVTFAPRARFQVIFKITVARRAAPNLLHRRAAQRRAPQIRVQNHPGRVDHRLQRQGQHSLHHGGNAFFQLRSIYRDHCGRSLPGDPLPHLGQDGARYSHHHVAIHALRKRRQPWLRQQFVHRRNLPQQIRLIVRKRPSSPRFHAAISTHRRPTRNAARPNPRPCRISPPASAILLTHWPSPPSMEAPGASFMATIDEEMSQLEKDIRQLKIEYDQYFGGGRKRPPTEIEWRIELIIKRYGERGGEMKFGQRFRYNNLTQTYAKYKDIFRKKLQQKEEGKVQRHFGAAAKAIEAERAKAAAEAHPAAPQPTSFRMICSEPERETDKVDQLYQAFQQAMQQTGGSIKQSRENFSKILATLPFVCLRFFRLFSPAVSSFPQNVPRLHCSTFPEAAHAAAARAHQRFRQNRNRGLR